MRKIKKIKTIPRQAQDSFYNVDPTRFALVSLGANANMLLHTIRARVHEKKSTTKKTPFARNLFCSTQ
ncbi:hypothetical protein A2608_01185 [Candidatus Azambacteria bacterium RIFOXYD1_FULL_44_10]|nr:MAG: hypothetical protein A3C78_00760 [Candidatus Azambacteria bacterium RIFCSPHIGHO2_02_FULL_45_18]OGD52433.1 MAG: hypothetical protein A2608_01185 [Candidatus Azambacteria bacterium RIFOXYD1_FULL_44_10]